MIKLYHTKKKRIKDSLINNTQNTIFNSFYEIQNQIYKERLQSIENVMQLIYRNQLKWGKNNENTFGRLCGRFSG